MPSDEEASAAAAEEETKLVEKSPAYKILGDRKYSHCGFMKIMVPKNVPSGDNFFICIPYYLGIASITNCMTRFKEMFPFIGINVGTFHRLYIFAGLLYLLYADFLMFDSKEFGNGALRSGGVLSASSSWMPSYTVENSILRDFIIDPNGKTDYKS